MENLAKIIFLVILAVVFTIATIRGAKNDSKDDNEPPMFFPPMC